MGLFKQGKGLWSVCKAKTEIQGCRSLLPGTVYMLSGFWPFQEIWMKRLKTLRLVSLGPQQDLPCDFSLHFGAMWISFSILTVYSSFSTDWRTQERSWNIQGIFSLAGTLLRIPHTLFVEFTGKRSLELHWKWWFGSKLLPPFILGKRIIQLHINSSNRWIPIIWEDVRS